MVVCFRGCSVGSTRLEACSRHLCDPPACTAQLLLAAGKHQVSLADPNSTCALVACLGEALGFQQVAVQRVNRCSLSRCLGAATILSHAHGQAGATHH